MDDGWYYYICQGFINEVIVPVQLSSFEGFPFSANLSSVDFRVCRHYLRAVWHRIGHACYHIPT